MEYSPSIVDNAGGDIRYVGRTIASHLASPKDKPAVWKLLSNLLKSPTTQRALVQRVLWCQLTSLFRPLLVL